MAVYTIRSLLDFLVEHDLDAIDRLCELRGLRGRGKAAKCESLARSYRGDHEQLFDDLRKVDLVALLKDPTDIDGEEFYLSSASSYPKEKLVRFALRIFRDEKPPREFVRLSNEDDGYEYDDSDDDDDDDGTAGDVDFSNFAEVDLLGAVSASAAKRSPNLLEWIAPAAGMSPAKLVRLVGDTHGSTLLRNVLKAIWPIDVPDGAGPVLSTLRASAVRRAPTLVAWVARLTGKSFEDVLETVRDVNGNTLLLRLFPTLTSEASRRRGGPREEKPASGGDQIVGGRWEIIQQLGEGGFGRVFEARDIQRSDGRPVVLKVARDANAAAHLRQEFEVGEQLRHPNICTYRDIGEDSAWGVFAVLDHGGQSLDKIIAASGLLWPEAVIDVTTQIARALDYAHDRNVMHQDVKPQNVLMQASHRRGWDVRLTDFGVSIRGRTGHRTDGVRTVVASEVVGYSWAYAAPEQRMNFPKRASDQFSLALVVCSMLERRVFGVPYQRREFGRLSTEQNRAIARALSMDAEQRFASCEEFARALGAGL